MPIIWGVFSALIFSKLGAWITSALVAIGIGFAVYGAAIVPAMQYVESAYSGLPATIIAWLGILNVDKYFTIVGGAYAGALVKRVIMRKLAA